MSMVLTVMPGVTSRAAEAEGETEASVSEMQDENIQRLEEVTAMDEDGSIREIDDANGMVDEADGAGGIALFSLRSFSPKVVNFNTKGNSITNYTDETNGFRGIQMALTARMQLIWEPRLTERSALCFPGSQVQ